MKEKIPKRNLHLMSHQNEQSSSSLNPPLHAVPSAPPTTSYSLPPSEGSVQFAAWLLRFMKDGSVQMVTKVKQNFNR